MIYREFSTESGHKIIFSVLWPIFFFLCKSDVLSLPFITKQKKASPECLRTALFNKFTLVSLFSISFWFLDVDQMQGKEAGDDGSTEVLV